MSDEMIVEFCSPTLAGIKTGNLFSCECDDYKNLIKDVRRVNSILLKKGIKAIPVRCLNNRVLIYLYRPSFLEKDLCYKDTAILLKKLGYNVENMTQCVMCLKNKLKNLKSNKEFPHEIGLFLGYPYEDVKGFIDNKGECSKCVGCWKVYGDEKAAQELFDKSRKCTEIYCRLYGRGSSLEKLTMTA